MSTSAVASHVSGPESEEKDSTLLDGAQYFHQCRVVFLICRMIQCVTATLILFFPRAAFSAAAGLNRKNLVKSDPHLLIHYGFNLGIAGGALVHNLVCYFAYSINKARLPFFIYAAIMDFAISNGFLGLLLTAILRGGVGTGIFYQVLCGLAWASFILSSFLEVSLVCVFNYLRKSSEQTHTNELAPQSTALDTSAQRTIVSPPREQPRRAKRPTRNVTVETVEDNTDVGRPIEQHITSVRRPETAHLSQATTIAEILQEAVEDTLERVSSN